jgi:NADPH:quinone reductase-like Zn-dependent oxidoreductase
MRAVYASSVDFDDPLDGLRVGDQPEAEVPEGSVRVHIEAAGLNWHDLWTLRGISTRPVEPPVILGMEGAGRLDDGSPVIIYPIITDADWRGDETLAPSRHSPSENRPGTFAERIVVPQRNAIPLPLGLDTVTAAVLGTAWLTAYRMLFTKARIRPGQTALVQGASGGVATALVQLACAAGIRVWVTGRTPEKQRLAQDLGADRTFPSRQPLPEPVDAVFDCVGQATWTHSLHAVRDGGTVVTCAATTGDAPSAELRHIIRHQIDIRGSQAGTREELLNLINFVVSRNLRPRISDHLPMGQARKGFERLWDGDTAGKVVLTTT